MGVPEALVGALGDKIQNLPALPGVYLFKDAKGRVLYVGKARSLVQRVRNYLGPDLEPRIQEMVERATDLDTILTASEPEALLLESTLIRQHRPHYNILLKDDKSFPYVRVSVQEEFPRLSVTRHVRSDGARYLGPYTDVRVLRRTLREIRRIFPVRTCRNFEDYRRADRPCLYFHIRRCAGPCTTRSGVGAAEYRAIVDGLLLFLTGHDQELSRELKADMERAAGERDYERAARRRDQIRLLESARKPQSVVAPNSRDADVVGVARHGADAAVVVLFLRGGRVVGKETHVLARGGGSEEVELVESFLGQHYLTGASVPPRVVVGAAPPSVSSLAEALGAHAGHRVEIAAPTRGREHRLAEIAGRNAAHALEERAARAGGRRARFSPETLDLQRTLGLAAPPHRMVCFDVSNLGAEGAVAAVVASEDGRPRKGLYRRMRMRRAGPDDFAMIREAVTRYWTRVESGELPRPDLVVVDGGAGQVGAARAALEETATRPVALIGLAKREELVVREGGAELRLPRRSQALRSLQRLRDEAHRFGLAYHRGLRRRARIASALDAVPGVGPVRRAALLRAFGSVAALRAADAAEISSRAGVPAALAEQVAAALAGLDAGAHARGRRSA
jgi:excinuclease ABC subunit C